MARRDKTRRGEANRSRAEPSRDQGAETVTRLRENGRRATMTDEAGLTGCGPALEGTGEGRRRERKSSIVAEGTGRPSVASTCCASRSHFTPLSSPNSVPSPFFYFFIFFFKSLLSGKKNSSCSQAPNVNDPPKDRVDSNFDTIPALFSFPFSLDLS